MKSLVVIYILAALAITAFFVSVNLMIDQTIAQQRTYQSKSHLVEINSGR